MNLKFDTRQGDRLNWQRHLVIETDDGIKGPYVLKMVTTRERPDPKTSKVRIFNLPNTSEPVAERDMTGEDMTGSQADREFRAGCITKEGKLLWQGRFSLDATPLRAFAVAAGLCDQNGDSALVPLPEWAE